MSDQDLHSIQLLEVFAGCESIVRGGLAEGLISSGFDLEFHGVTMAVYACKENVKHIGLLPGME